jgi:energy-coupling factor transport system permease protein
MFAEFARPGNSLLHRFDPRAKLIALVLFAAAFFLPVPVWVTALYAAVLVLIVLACLGPAELGGALATIAPVLLIICLLTPVFHRGGAVIWSVSGFALLTADGLRESARLVLRFMGLTLAFFAAFRSLDMNELILALRWYGLSYRVSLVIIVALRFIPSLFVVYRNVQDAHLLRRSRGRKAGFFQRTLPVLTSVFIQAIRGIPSLAMAMETRGFGRRGRRSEYRVLPKRSRLIASMGVTVVLAALVLFPLAL